MDEVSKSSPIALKEAPKPTGESLLTPPPAKKLKQVRLPFKVLSPVLIQPTSPSAGSKKRKSSDPSSLNQKATKAARTDDDTKHKKLPSKTPPKLDAENEVSSSSEADCHTKVPKLNEKNDAVKEKPKPKGLIDRFVRPIPTQQLEVSTSCLDDAVICLEDSNEAEPAKPNKEEKPEDNTCTTSTSETQNIPSRKQTQTQSPSVSTPKANAVSTSDGSPRTTPKSVTPKSSPESNSPETSSPVDVSKTPASSKPKARGRPSGSTPASTKKVADKDAEKKKKQEEKERQRLEKLKEKEEKERQKREEKEKKEKERQEAKEQKEKELQEKKEQKEQERLEKEKQKEEERKKKQEVIDAKNEEKRKKEEERLQKEEEKRKIEDEKKLKEQKKKAAFQSFFTKAPKPSPQVAKPASNSPFFEFEVKENMRLAPLYRIAKTDMCQKAENLDPHLATQDCTTLYLDQIKTGSLKPGSGSKTWPLDLLDESVTIADSDKRPCRMKAKLLQFHENYRPAYYGTWRKKSAAINPRNPLKTDKALLDYEVDSDDEWEEEEPGESLSDAEKDEDEDKDPDEDEEDEDGFFVPHGYLSDGEGGEEEEEENDPDRMKARQLAKARAWEMEMKSSKCEVLRAVVAGCHWWTPGECLTNDPILSMLTDYRVEVIDAETPISVEASAPVKVKGEKASNSKKAYKGPNLQAVPDEALPDLIRLVHGNVQGVPKIIKEFREFWRLKKQGGSLDASKTEATEEAMEVDNDNGANTSLDISGVEDPNVSQSEKSGTSPSPSGGNSLNNENMISKRQLKITLNSISLYEKRDCYKKCCWWIHDSVLKQHNLTDLPVPTQWQWITRTEKKVAEGEKTPGANNKPGRKTPTPGSKKSEKESASSSAEAKITQFAVVGLSPKVALPSPSAVKQEQSPVVPKVNKITQFTVAGFTPKMPEASPKPSKSPLTLASLMSPKPVPGLQKTIPGGASSTPKRQHAVKPVTPSVLFNTQGSAVQHPSVNKLQVTNESSNSNDCMIVDEDEIELKPLPTQLEKGQLTLLGLLKAKPK